MAHAGVCLLSSTQSKATLKGYTVFLLTNDHPQDKQQPPLGEADLAGMVNDTPHTSSSKVLSLDHYLGKRRDVQVTK